ncbi:MAG: cache domain-containing protein, partial [Chloroflexi bacterium]|nr:cache domain-containing protein [Chloroflexota bacterium]
MKLSFKLPLLIIISAAIVAAAVGVMQFLTVQASIINTENEANMNSVSAYASSVGFYLDQAQDIMEITASEVEAALSSNLSTSGQSEEELHQSVHNIASAVQENSKVFEYIIFLNTDGTVRVIEPDDLLQGMARKDLGYTDWYKKLIGNGQTVISNLRISPTTQRPTVVIAVPVHGPDAKIIGIVAGGLNLGQLSQIGTMGQQAGQPLRYGLITDGKGLIIADQANPKNVLEQTDFSSALPVQAALSGKTGTMRFVSLIDGIDKLAAYMPLAGTGWAAEYWVPVQVAFEPLYRLSAYMTGLAVLMIILMGIGSLLI